MAIQTVSPAIMLSDGMSRTHNLGAEGGGVVCAQICVVDQRPNQLHQLSVQEAVADA